MPICKKCGTSFALSRAEERLVALGKIDATYCMACAKKTSKKVPASADEKANIPIETLTYAKLVKIEEFRTSGRISYRFIAVAPKRRPPKQNALTNQKKSLIGVQPLFTVDTEDPHTPRTIIHSNVIGVLTDKKLRRDPRTVIWFSKLPAYNDPVTGAPRIECLMRDVVAWDCAHEHAHEQKHIKLTLNLSESMIVCLYKPT